LLRLVGLTVRLRRRRYIGVVILHHLTTEIGARKFQALARATGSRLIAGLDNGRGEFLTHRALDLGFGARHEVEYALAVARAAGGAEVDPAPRITHEWSHTALGLPERYIALYPATGAYSSARTWPANSFAEVASVITARGDAIVILGSDDARPAASIIRARCPAAIDLTGATPLEKLVVIVSRARAVVGGDSFIGHLAAARPTSTRGGHTVPSAYQEPTRCRLPARSLSIPDFPALHACTLDSDWDDATAVHPVRA
jgi:heptosyltransferase-2